MRRGPESTKALTEEAFEALVSAGQITEAVPKAAAAAIALKWLERKYTALRDADLLPAEETIRRDHLPDLYAARWGRKPKAGKNNSPN